MIDWAVKSLLVIRFTGEIQSDGRSTKEHDGKRKKKRQDEVDDVQLREIGRRAIVKDGSPPGPGNLCLTENFFYRD